MEYSVLCQTYARIDSTSKRLEKTRFIAELLKQSGESLRLICYLLQGRIHPAWNKEVLGISHKLIIKVLAQVSGSSTQHIERTWEQTGDLGIVAEQHIRSRTQETLFSQTLTVQHVHTQLSRIAQTQGVKSTDIKLKIISELLSNVSGQEAKYLIRTILEQLRIGTADATMRDAIIYAFLAQEAGVDANYTITEREAYTRVTTQVQNAYDRINDFGVLAETARKGLEEIKQIRITLGKPIKIMLGYKGTTPTNALKTLDKPVLFQYKYDGFRVEIHKQDDEITIFTRRLENVTEQFPDVVAYAREAITARNVILDAEAIGLDKHTGAYKPFQHISQRIRRKHSIEEVAKELPVEVRVFDILYKDDEEVLEHSLEHRQHILEQTIHNHKQFLLAHTIITGDEKEAEEFYTQALREGVEGVFAKKITSTYQPGTRVGTWIKLKDTHEPIDVTIVGAEWGEGKRSGWLTSFTLAIQDEEGNLCTIGKVGTGLKEKEEEGFSFPEITRLLEPLIREKKGKEVVIEPGVQVEVTYEELQKSSAYDSGYALRFPRILRNRTEEKNVEDITNIHYIEQIYREQE